LLERRVLLESLSAVELVKADEGIEQKSRERGGENMKITVSEQTIPAASLTKAV
jgi:hypothetical protein